MPELFQEPRGLIDQGRRRGREIELLSGRSTILDPSCRSSRRGVKDVLASTVKELPALDAMTAQGRYQSALSLIPQRNNRIHCVALLTGVRLATNATATNTTGTLTKVAGSVAFHSKQHRRHDATKRNRPNQSRRHIQSPPAASPAHSPAGRAIIPDILLPF